MTPQLGVGYIPDNSLPRFVDNFLPQSLFDRLQKHVLHQPMEFGAKSNTQTDPFGHLSWAPVHNSQGNLADLSELFKEKDKVVREAWEQVAHWLGDNVKLIRCYANGYTYGMDGYFHTDSDRTGEVTVILCMNKEWRADWAGETCCMDETKYLSALPRPNRAIIIPATMLHCGRAVSRMCKELRVTLMFKTRPHAEPLLEKLSRWLVQNNALSIDHTGNGTLHDHLFRVADALRRRACPDHVVLGGGLHSIYGTNSFQHKLFAANDYTRSMVAVAWGQEAENLAYTFSILDRPRTLNRMRPSHLDNGAMELMTSFGKPLSVSFPQFCQLRYIEAANLDDQGSLEKWGDIKQVWDECKTWQ